jgi:hypothetical protein
VVCPQCCPVWVVWPYKLLCINKLNYKPIIGDLPVATPILPRCPVPPGRPSPLPRCLARVLWRFRRGAVRLAGRQGQAGWRQPFGRDRRIGICRQACVLSGYGRTVGCDACGIIPARARKPSQTHTEPETRLQWLPGKDLNLHKRHQKTLSCLVRRPGIATALILPGIGRPRAGRA